MGWADLDALSPQERKQVKRQVMLRAILRGIGRLNELLLTRTTIEGKENIPSKGPVIFAANHFSTYDAVMLLTHLPPQSQVMGPGDFKMTWPASLIIDNIGLIKIVRGSVDRGSVKQANEVLRRGGFLGLFPEGGTWEKGLEDVKGGATYFSMANNAPIVPVAIGGTYQVWRKMYALQRPRVIMRFGEPIPPIKIKDRKTRQEELRAASLALMRVIYDMLPLADQRRYDEIPRQRFWATLDFLPTMPHHNDVPSLEGLAELVSKPNLFSPLHNNAQLPLQPFHERLGRYTPAHQLVRAIRALQKVLETSFAGYLEYRLGEEKANRISEDLEALLAIAQDAARHDIAVRFSAHVRSVE